MASQSEIDDIRATRRERDMILAPNEYAFISDETKGEVNAFVGPNKTSLAGTDRPVLFNNKSKRFQSCALAEATQTFQTAPEGWYVILKNPAAGDKHPSGNGKLSTPDLRVGKKVNISGPASFALWPGQMAKVVQGHNLKSNEFLLARVYDEEAARANWTKAVIKTQTEPTVNDAAPEAKPGRKAPSTASSKASTDQLPNVDELTMGKLFVIRGTDVSFYIPSTGIEVVPEKANGEERYVREAVSLERLEYCLLLDQDGNKRYVRGPAVVFPRPTEKFVEAPIKSNPDGKVKAKKFRAQELTEQSGIHIRVISDYTDDGRTYKEGEELFITGAEQPVYFPREEHAIIKYGEQDVHYGIAIPAGEARYVLNRKTGVASIVAGPQIFLADPRSQVILQRAVDLKLCSLLYPGNEEALTINAERLGVADQDFMGGAGANAAFLNSSYTRGEGVDEAYGAVAAAVTPDTNRRILIKSASKSLPGDAFDRKSKFTAPRSLILNTKYDGAVVVRLWTNYAMLLVRGNERRIIQGPGSFMLEYDEVPQVMTLSTGKPKTTDKPFQTVYLQVKNNVVSDLVEVETKDYCRLNVKLSYKVNFEGESSQWFNVDNYVKFLCDHMRSKIRNAVRKHDVQEFYEHQTEILRDVILGKSTKDGNPRSGAVFSENGMRIYDTEILKVDLLTPGVEKTLVEAQRSVIDNTLLLAAEKRKLEYIKSAEEIKRQVADTNAETRRLAMELQATEAKRKLELDLTIIASNAKAESERIAREREAADARAANELAAEKAQAEVSAVQLDVQRAADAQRLEQTRHSQELELKKLEAQVEGLVKKAAAVSPDFIAALQAYGDKAMIEKVSEAMAPLSILGGGSVVEVLKKLLEGTTLAKHLEPATNGHSTGTSRSRSTSV